MKQLEYIKKYCSKKEKEAKSKAETIKDYSENKSTQKE